MAQLIVHYTAADDREFNSRLRRLQQIAGKKNYVWSLKLENGKCSAGFETTVIKSLWLRMDVRHQMPEAEVEVDYSL